MLLNSLIGVDPFYRVKKAEYLKVVRGESQLSLILLLDDNTSIEEKNDITHIASFSNQLLLQKIILFKATRMIN